MKKILFTIVLLIASTMAFAQSADAVMNEFKAIKGAEYMTMPKEMMAMAASMSEDESAKDVIKNLDAINVLSLNETTKEVVDKVMARINDLKKNGYSQIMSSDKDEEQTIVFTKGTEEVLHELLIVTIETNKMNLVNIKGKMSMKDVGSMTQMGK